MQIFLSHSSKQKPLVREVMRNLPVHIGAWLDEQKLLFGDDIPSSLEETIKLDTDYVLVFIDEHAVASSWVAKELKWAIEAEKSYGRVILLPIVIEKDAFHKIGIGIQNRKFLSLKDYSETSIRALSDDIASELFALVCRDIDSLRNLKQNPIVSISDANTLIRNQASLIQNAVFPHRQLNPISLKTLREVINSQSEVQLDGKEFESVLSTIIHHGLIPGLYFDGFDLYLIEEHARWKAEVHHDRKERIGRKVASLINNGAKVFLDAGSTTSEIAAIISKKIESRILTKITLVTTSIYIANMISDCCVRMGFDDTFSAVQLFVPGGQVRQGTQAIVSTEADSHQILRLADYVGGFDIGIIGVNGVDLDHGFTTKQDGEVMNKIDIMSTSKMRLMVGDSSKIGIVLEGKFADFSDDLQFVVNNDADNKLLTVIAERYKDKVILA